MSKCLDNKVENTLVTVGYLVTMLFSTAYVLQNLVGWFLDKQYALSLWQAVGLTLVGCLATGSNAFGVDEPKSVNRILFPWVVLLVGYLVHLISQGV